MKFSLELYLSGQKCIPITEEKLLQTYLFYDIESTGLNKSFDQVLHFAAIRTDLALNELTRHEVKIKLHPDLIPSPYALITHKMGITEITQNGLCEFEAMQCIHQWLNEPGTISLGYNTLGFDDEFLRFSFYRNLLKPYTHQYANQCGRMDIFPMTVMYFLFKSHVLNWPTLNEQISLKLENLNAANQLSVGRAHHAMVDVEVTLELARRLLREPTMWNHLQGYFQKEIDSKRSQALQLEPALLIQTKLGSKNFYQCPVLFLGNHVHYKNQSQWLRLDTEDFTQFAPEQLIEKVYVINKKVGEPNFLLPLKERFLTHLTSDRLTLAMANEAWLQAHPDLFQQLKQHYIHYQYPIDPYTDAEAALYTGGFWSRDEELFCQRFHQSTPQEKARWTDNIPPSRLKTLATRILARNYPAALSQQQQLDFTNYLARIQATQEHLRLVDFRGQLRLTPAVALAEIQKIRTEREMDASDLKLLIDFENYLCNHFHLDFLSA